MQAGVIDPTKVARTALQNAASIAGLLLTTEAIVVEKKEDKPAPCRSAAAAAWAGCTKPGEIASLNDAPRDSGARCFGVHSPS